MTAIDTLPQAPATPQSGLDFDAVLRTYEAVSRILTPGLESMDMSLAEFERQTRKEGAE